MSAQAIVCPNCGAKVKASRSQCPRCRAELRPSDVSAAPGALQHPWAPKIAAGTLALAALFVGVIWFNQSAPEPSTPVTAAADPFAARRQKGPAAAPAAAESVVSGGGIPSSPAFIEPESVMSLPGGRTPDATLLDVYRSAVQQNPQDADALGNVGRALVLMGRPAEGLAPLRQSMDLAPDRWLLAMAHGLACARLEKWSEAVASFRRARGLMATDAATSYDLALALQRQTAHQDAATEFAAAVRLNQSAAEAHLGLAISLDRLGRTADAVNAYKEAQRLFQQGPDADKVTARIVQLER